MSDRRISYTHLVAAVFVVLLLAIAAEPPARVLSELQQESCLTFQETGKRVCEPFLTYWREHGGLPQQGFPISNVFAETSEIDGKFYTIQYFERAVFELHAENQPPYDVLPSLLGTILYKQKYTSGVPGQQPNSSPNSIYFPQTGKRLGGKFLDYWQQHGGLMQQGYPISDEFTEVSNLDGKGYIVQYFERSVFELHTENKPPYDILLSQLGAYRLRGKYLGGDPSSATPIPTPDAFIPLTQRPLQLPTIASDGKCPTTRARELDHPNSKFLAFGNGPVYLQKVNSNEDGVIDLTRLGSRNGYFGEKGPWVSRPEYPGPILVRGQQIDGPSKVLFEYEQKPIQEDMRLGTQQEPLKVWSFWPSSILFAGPGCYGLQIDGLSFTDVIVLETIRNP